MVKFKVTASLIVTGTLNVPPSVCNGTSVRPLASSLASGYKRNRLAARSNTAIPMTICNAFLWGGAQFEVAETTHQPVVVETTKS